jgi:hypothetical protein
MPALQDRPTKFSLNPIYQELHGGVVTRRFLSQGTCRDFGGSFELNSQLISEETTVQ